MNTQFFLYAFSLEEKNKLLEKVVGNKEDLIFVFDLHDNKIVFHNNCISPLSNWDKFLSAPNFIDAIRSKLSSNDIPALIQLIDKAKSISERDFIVRELHIKNKAEVYGHYQIEFSLFEKNAGKPSQIMCKVHTLQDSNKVMDLNRAEKGYRKIILVDDDELTNILNKKLIQAVLPNADLEVFVDVDNALDWLKVNDTGGDFLIFLDINFPKRNGWDFMEDYDQFISTSKVIMLSSSIDHADKKRAMQYKEVLQYISKPLSFEYLESILK
jgi:CheY-like chemotaxis protein